MIEFHAEMKNTPARFEQAKMENKSSTHIEDRTGAVAKRAIKSQVSLLSIYYRLSDLQSSLLGYGAETYPECDDPLLRSMRAQLCFFTETAPKSSLKCVNKTSPISLRSMAVLVGRAK